MEIRWLRKALGNLEQEASYVAREDPAAARMVVQRIWQAVSLLAENPALGQPGRIHGTRELVINRRRYLIPYRVNPRLQCIEILRVFHASRKPPQRW
ncbi:type II toxin-antitoxin system RelE/ParE family toxin [Sulfurivermis fontis]|jgi:toxin ParE1/3/4|uniref:type II toxin-antitoxin system RelE/ParE family toxin n=1 Tax=Sulfurivermis fontis TaxID=1972068 RepID=UPI000FDC2A93|nr:type II toxin-antitoxin system RelE/ParE family toxin [Sulfurivermis fontis]